MAKGFEVPKDYSERTEQGQRAIDDYRHWIKGSGPHSRLGIFYRSAKTAYEREKGVVSSAEYARRFARFLEVSPPVVLTSEKIDDLDYLAELISSKPKSIVCLDTSERLRWAMSDAQVRVYQVATDYDIAFTPPFTNEGSRDPLGFDGCVVMYPNGIESNPSTVPSMEAMIEDRSVAEAWKQQADAYVENNCTWRELVADVVEQPQ